MTQRAKSDSFPAIVGPEYEQRESGVLVPPRTTNEVLVINARYQMALEIVACGFIQYTADYQTVAKLALGVE